jgi:hypothetical protein
MMSFQYPAKPWVDGQEIKIDFHGKEVVIAKYDASKNLWTHLRVNDAGDFKYVTSCDVIINRDCSDPCIPNIEWENITNLQTALDYLYYWLWDESNGAIPRLDRLEDKVEELEDIYKELLQIINNLGGLQNLENLLIAIQQIVETLEDHEERIKDLEDNWRDRAHIVSNSPPTKHPDFGDDPLKVGDLWIDASNIMHYWNGSEWIEVVDSESYADKYLKKHGHDVDDAPNNVVYSWNKPLSFSSEENISITANTSGLSRSIIAMPTDGSTRINSTNFLVNSDGNTSMYSEGGTNIVAKSDLNLGSNENEVAIGALKDIWLAAGKNVLIETVGDIILSGVGPTSKELLLRTILKDSAPDKQITNKEYVDAQDEILQQEIIELEEEIDAFAPSTQRGEWEFDMSNGAPAPGKYYLLKELFGGGTDFTDQYSEAVAAVFHNTDANGVNNTWSGVTVDELIQIFDKPDPDFVLGTITAVDTTTVQDAVLIRFDRERGEGSPDNNPDIKVSRVNIFKAPSGGTASDFVLKTGDEMSGDLTFLSSYDAYHHDATTASTRIEFKNTKSDGTTVGSTYLYKLGTVDGIASSGQLRCKSILAAGGDLIGWDASSGNTYNSRINLGSTGGQLKWGGNQISAWSDNGLYYYGDVTAHNHVATKEYVDATAKSYVSSGKRLGEWYSTSSNYDPGNQCYEKGEAKRYDGHLYISFRDRDNVDHRDYFSSLKLGDKLYFQKRDSQNFTQLEEATITTIILNTSECKIAVKPYDIFELSKTYILYDGLPQSTASVPSPNNYYIKLTSNDSVAAPVDLEITDEYIYKMTSRGELSTSNLMNGVFIPYAWIKRRYPNFSGFNPMEGINKSFIQGNMSRKAIFDPYGNASYELLIVSKKFNNVPGIAFYSSNRDIDAQGGTPMELYGIQEAIYFN